MNDPKATRSDSKAVGAEKPQPLSSRSSRRNFLQAGMTGVAAAVAAGSGFSMLESHSVEAQSTQTPDAALKELMQGNRRFADGKMTSHDRNLESLRRDLAQSQKPFAAILSCADSRVPVEIVFDRTIGELFVTRLAGNMVTPEIIASLEYGAEVLGTKVILVLGHSDCGAVKAAIAGKPVPGQISALYPHLQPAVDQSGSDVKAVTKTNAEIQARLLSEASTVVANRIKTGQLKVVAGYYDIGSGVVTVLD